MKRDTGYKSLKREKEYCFTKWGEYMKRAQTAERKLRVRTSFTVSELFALNHFLDIAYSDYDADESETGRETCKEIERLKDKIGKITNELRAERPRK